MKVIEKKQLKFVDGYIVDGEGNVLNNPRLVDQYNAYCAVVDLNEFIAANRKDIEASQTNVVYTPAPSFKPAVVLPKPKQPTFDKKQKEALALWNELESEDQVNSANQNLAEVNDLLTFIADSMVLLTGEVTTDKFNGNVLELTQDEVVQAYLKYSENQELRDKLVIKL